MLSSADPTPPEGSKTQNEVTYRGTTLEAGVLDGDQLDFPKKCGMRLSSTEEHFYTARRRTDDRRHIILLGDSITQQSFDTEHCGWGASLASAYSRSADVKNRGFSGYNSRWVLQMLPKIMPSEDPECVLVTVFLGANDSAISEVPSQYVPLEEYGDNLRSILAYCQRLNPAASIVLVTPPCVDATRWPDRSDDAVSQYAQLVRDIAAQDREVTNRKSGGPVHLLDLWQSDNAASAIEIADLRDGLHFGSTGSKKMFAKLLALLTGKCPQLRPNIDGQPMQHPHFPLWSDLAGKSKTETEDILNNWTW